MPIDLALFIIIIIIIIVVVVIMTIRNDSDVLVMADRFRLVKLFY